MAVASEIIKPRFRIPDFSSHIEKLRLDDVQRLSRLIDVNRIAVPVYDLLNSLGSRNAQVLKQSLESIIARIQKLERSRDELLGRLSRVFDDAYIDYAVYKTLNSLGYVGVDIDVIIDPSSYDRCVEVLLADGFFPIDNLSKRYATGFIVKGYATIVDLHTELAVLGVRYLSSSSLLRRSQEIEFQPSYASNPFPLKVIDGVVDALVRMAHCVLKEGSITVGDVAETSYHLGHDLDATLNCVKDEGLKLAASIFSYIALDRLGLEQYGPLITFERSFTHGLARSMIHDQSRASVPPIMIPSTVSIIALFDKLKKGREVSRYLLLPMSSLRYERNAAHLGRKILERLYD